MNPDPKENIEKYLFINRVKVNANSKFYVYFDHLVDFNKREVKDFLTVKPRISKENKIVGISVLPYFKNKFCLMKGWRHQFNEFIYQAPAGFVEENENAAETALRELNEETSLSCELKDLISLGTYIPDAGLIEGRVALFLALKCKLLDKNLDKEFGTGELVFYTKKELTNLIQNSSNIGGSSLITAFRALKKISSLGLD